jgi:hypothetical protein
MRRALAALAVVAAALLSVRPAAAQSTLAGMVDECQASMTLPSPTIAAGCVDAAVALGALRAGIGLAAAQGSAVPGSASTLGRRMASSPRLAFSVRPATARATYGGPADGKVHALWPAGLEGQLTVGLLEGWSPLPTVGGVLSLDVLGELGFERLSGGAGFDGSIQDAGYGARVGLLRESFTLPGVSVSVTRRHLGDVKWGPQDGPGTRLVFTPTVTSLRATASKDLLSFGVLGGWGWDRYAGASSLTVRGIAAEIMPSAQASSGDFRTDRQMVFGGLSYTLLVLQLSGEVGWARGFSGPTTSSGFEPGSSSLFGSVAARLTY